MKIRIQRTWYGWKAWDPTNLVGEYVHVVSRSEDGRDRVIEKARRKFTPKPPKWEEVDV